MSGARAASARWRPSSSPIRAVEEAPRAGSSRTTPDVQALAALDPRDDPDDRVLEGAHRGSRHARPPPTNAARRVEPPDRRYATYAARCPAGIAGAGRPAASQVGDASPRAPRAAPRVDERRQARVGRRDRARERQQDVIASPLERAAGMRVRVAPGVVDVQRGAVVDQPRPAVPDEQVRVPRRAVGVRRRARRARRRRPRQSGSGRAIGRRAEGHRAGQEVEPEVEPGALLEQVAGLLVGLGVAEGRIDLDDDELRHRQPDRPRRARRRATPRRAPAVPAPAPRNLTTYRPSSSASTSPGSEPPSRSGVT